VINGLDWLIFLVLLLSSKVGSFASYMVHRIFSSESHRQAHCSTYGIFVWNVKLEGATQDDLVITRESEPTITVDNLKIAQFIYLLLTNVEIRDVIDTIAKKAVLILGRFTTERKAVLDALKEALRAYGYLPILFDFDKPSSQDLTETVSTLAHLSRFIIVDLTDPSSAPYEVGMIASNHAYFRLFPAIRCGKKGFRNVPRPHNEIPLGSPTL
jgi:hypothetical protein